MANIIFDFDGVINSYASGWKGATCIPDLPVNGVKEAIKEIRDNGYKVFILSTRCFQEGGKEAIEHYLEKYDIDVDGVIKEKIPAIVTIDDRCICFNGNTSSLLTEIKNFKPWNK